MLASMIDTITLHHLTSSLPIITSHHALPPSVKEHYIFTKHTHVLRGCLLTLPHNLQSNHLFLLVGQLTNLHSEMIKNSP